MTLGDVVRLYTILDNFRHRIINKGRKLTRVGTFEVFVPANVTPRILAVMLKESLLRSKH